MEIVTLANHDPQYVTWSDHIVPWLIALGLLAIAILIGYANYQNAKPFRIESSTVLPPESALDALQSRMAQDGWSLGYRDAGSLIMSADKNASFGSTAALGCLSLWIALLYLLVSKKRITVQIDASDTVDGAILITNGTRSGNGVLLYMGDRLRELPKS